MPDLAGADSVEEVLEAEDSAGADLEEEDLVAVVSVVVDSAAVPSAEED
jgi:hypothetical protein